MVGSGWRFRVDVKEELRFCENAKKSRRGGGGGGGGGAEWQGGCGRCYEKDKTGIFMFEILEPGGSALGKYSI